MVDSAENIIRRKKFLQAIIGFASVILVIVVMVVLVNSLGILPEDRDSRLCLTGGDPPAVTGILIDRSEAYNPQQVRDIKNSFGQWLRYGKRIKDQHSPINEKVFAPNNLLLLYALDEIALSSSEEITPLVEVCKPPDWELPVEWYKKPAKNIDLEKHEFLKKFLGPMMDALDSLIREPQGLSPIMEMIQAISSSNAWGQYPDRPHYLVILSDMVQNTEQYSHLRDTTDWERFRSQFPNIYSRVKTSLHGVEWNVLYVHREATASIQKRSHQEFWQNYFQDAGTAAGRFILIEGE